MSDCHQQKPALADAAETLGASPWRAWWSIDFAVARRSIGVAIGLAFTVALGEFGASSFLATPRSEVGIVLVDPEHGYALLLGILGMVFHF